MHAEMFALARNIRSFGAPRLEKASQPSLSMTAIWKATSAM
jgi:hypothetical protein